MQAILLPFVVSKARSGKDSTFPLFAHQFMVPVGGTTYSQPKEQKLGEEWYWKATAKTKMKYLPL